MYKRLLSVFACLTLATSVLADEASLKKTIEAAYPKIKIDSIAKTPFPGLYEIYVDGQIMYSDEKFNFLITEGRLVNPKTKQDITSARLDELNRIDFATLPLDLAIKVVKGNGSRKLVVFSDPDCPYCKKLEQKELVNITDVTIYTFLFPLEQLHPDAANKSRAIWCSSDKVKAWQDWIISGQLPKTVNTCDTPVEKTAYLARQLRVTSTPTLFFEDGRRMLGAYPAAEIEKGLVVKK
jgi:thiol:disulfide interchange protein DsbC